MEKVLGLLKIHVSRGVNLAVRDVRSSDPYVIIRMGKHKLKTHAVKKSLNPEWNEDLTLSITDENKDLPIKLKVYDEDMFTPDDEMGEAEFYIHPILEAVNMRLHGSIPNGTTIMRVLPNQQNCLAEESCIRWVDGKIVQHMFLRLHNVECGEVELQLKWIDAPNRTAH